MENLEIYNSVREVPKEAQKTINGGRLKGMTDINPMWRIQKLTEKFGPCGFGWKYIIRDKRIEPGNGDEMAAFVDIDLYYKIGGEWSEAVPGTGGASFVSKERNGAYLSDECFKMALTDALSVSCKALGMGADVYWAAGRSKYSGCQQEATAEEIPGSNVVCADCNVRITDSKKRNGSIWTALDILSYSKKRFGRCLCPECQRKEFEKQKADTP